MHPQQPPGPPHQGYPPQQGHPPQQGQPQQQGYPPQYAYPPNARPVRSAIPKVVGILAIVFSCFGVIGAMIQTAGLYSDLDEHSIPASMLGNFETWAIVYMVLAVVLFGVHLTAGILSVRYSPRAPKFITIYAVFAFVLIIANCTITATMFPESIDLMMLEGAQAARYGLEVFAVPWPIVALSLMSSKRAREACLNPATRAVSAGVFS